MLGEYPAHTFSCRSDWNVWTLASAANIVPSHSSDVGRKSESPVVDMPGGNHVRARGKLRIRALIGRRLAPLCDASCAEFFLGAVRFSAGLEAEESDFFRPEKLVAVDPGEVATIQQDRRLPERRRRDRSRYLAFERSIVPVSMPPCRSPRFGDSTAKAIKSSSHDWARTDRTNLLGPVHSCH
jgi:hypothetical protein